jgi:hypothetical protein
LANGFQSLANNATGSYNIALGRNAGLNLTTGSNNIDIRNPGVADEAAPIRIGNPNVQASAFMAGIAFQESEGRPIHPRRRKESNASRGRASLICETIPY